MAFDSKTTSLELPQQQMLMNLPEKIIGIELCAARFSNNREVAVGWIQNQPELEDLLVTRNFNLKATGVSRFLSSDPRKVFAWYSPSTYKAKMVAIRRPTRYVAYYVKIGFSNDDWSADEVPPMTEENKLKLKHKDEEKKLREIERNARRIEASAKRAQLKEKQKEIAARIKAEMGIVDIPKAPKKRKRPVKVEEPLEELTDNLGNHFYWFC